MNIGDTVTAKWEKGKRFEIVDKLAMASPDFPDGWAYLLKDEDVQAILDGSISKERLEALNKDIDAFAERLIDELAFDLQKELDDIEDKKKMKEHEEDKWEDNLDDFPRK